jgi:hypothetical protein
MWILLAVLGCSGGRGDSDDDTDTDVPYDGPIELENLSVTCGGDDGGYFVVDVDVRAESGFAVFVPADGYVVLLPGDDGYSGTVSYRDLLPGSGADPNECFDGINFGIAVYAREGGGVADCAVGIIGESPWAPIAVERACEQKSLWESDCEEIGLDCP